jgi:cytochrome c2
MRALSLIKAVLPSGAHRARKRSRCGARTAGRLALAAALPMLLAACDDPAQERDYPAFGGDPVRGAQLIGSFGCGSCHQIPGINGADGVVGPPLYLMGRRIYVAGVLRNTPENMMFWLQNPQLVVPGNAMPDMGIARDQARDIAAYLYTLQ